MKVQHTLICIFFFSLQDGNADPGENIFYEVMGANITIECPISHSKTWKVFCRDTCTTGTLIKTTDDRAQSGRYSIKYNEGSFPVLDVSITELTKSDTGQYRCGWGRFLLSVSFVKFRIIVADALLDGNYDPSQKPFFTKPGSSLTVGCSFSVPGTKKSFCSRECIEGEILVETYDTSTERDRYSIGYEEVSPSGGVLYVTLKDLTTSDSGWYRCYLDRDLRISSYREFEMIVSDASATSKPNLTESTDQSEQFHPGGTTSRDIMLYVGPSLVVTVIVMSVVVFIIYRRKSSKSKDPTGERDYAAVTETNTVYEDIGHNQQSRAPAVEIDSLYSCAIFNKATRVETDDDDYICFTQHNDENDFGEVAYSEVNFSNRNIGFPNRAPSGNSSDVIYSVPQVDSSSDGR